MRFDFTFSRKSHIQLADIQTRLYITRAVIVRCTIPALYQHWLDLIYSTVQLSDNGFGHSISFIISNNEFVAFAAFY